MSLINKMLNELEKTKQAGDPERSQILSSITPTTQKYNLASKLKILVIILLIATLFGLGCYFYSKSITKKPKTARAQTVAIKAAAIVEPTIKLKNIVLQTANDKTIMDFVLSGPTLYYLEHSADQQQLFITLNNTGLLGNLPVSLENSLVIALNTKQAGSNVVCTLTLIPGTKVDELQLANQSQLHLVLSNPQLTNSKMSKVPIPPSQEQQQNQNYQEIQQLINQNNLKEAVTKLYLFIGDYPDQLQARETLAMLLIREGDLQKADNILKIGLNKAPNYSPFIKLKARILVEQGGINQALEMLQKFANLFDEDADYLALLAISYQQKGEFMKAAEFYNKLTKIQPQKTAWWVGLGIALESAGKKNAAREAYIRASSSPDTSADLIAFLSEKTKN